MYEKFFGLKRECFQITPDPQFLYLSESHKQALASIRYSIKKQKGLVAITGGVGVGKTTIVRVYLDGAMADDLKVIYVFHALNKLTKRCPRQLQVNYSARATIVRRRHVCPVTSLEIYQKQDSSIL